MIENTTITYTIHFTNHNHKTMHALWNIKNKTLQIESLIYRLLPGSLKISNEVSFVCLEKKIIITRIYHPFAFSGIFIESGIQKEFTAQCNASFQTKQYNKTECFDGPTLTFGTILQDEMLYPVYYLGSCDISEDCSSTVNIKTWETTIVKRSIFTSSNPSVFQIIVDYCAESFTGCLVVNEIAYEWSGKRIWKSSL